MFVTTQYEPDYASSSMESTRTAAQDIDTQAQGKVVRSITGSGEISKRSGTQTTKALIE